MTIEAETQQVARPRVDLGVFLPIAKNGFIRSSNAPPYYPSYRDNLEITLLAEEIGLDYAFSMLKWKGFGGETQFWDASLESFSLMIALAAATGRLALIATVNPLLFHPTAMAKMAATADAVSGGRFGLNLITGATLREYEQMGVLPDGYDRNRYAYAAEWLQVLKRLWSEPSVTHDGQYFHLEDCVSEPKPLQKPHPFLVCAGASDEGLRFTAGSADYGFINGPDPAALLQSARKLKGMAAEAGRTIKIAASAMLMIADTRAAAEAQWAHLVAGADDEALSNSVQILTSQPRESARAYGAERLASRKINSGELIIGSPQDVADGLIELVAAGGLDSVVTTFPDYLDGLRRFGRDVMPLLKRALDVGPEGRRMVHGSAEAVSRTG